MPDNANMRMVLRSNHNVVVVGMNDETVLRASAALRADGREPHTLAVTLGLDRRAQGGPGRPGSPLIGGVAFRPAAYGSRVPQLALTCFSGTRRRLRCTWNTHWSWRIRKAVGTRRVGHPRLRRPKTGVILTVTDDGERASGGGCPVGRAAARPVVGFCTIGLEAYWEQFPGLRAQLLGYARIAATRLSRDAELVNVGMVDTPAAGAAAGAALGRAGVDLVVVHVGTYATSSQVIPLLQRAGAPVLVLNLQPAARLDYAASDTADWLAHCSACCVPELAGALARCAIPFRVVSGTLQGPHAERAWARIAAWCRAAGLRRVLREARIGFLGHTYPGMLDLYADFTQHHGQLGLHVEVLELEDLAAEVEAAAPPEVVAVLERTRRMFDVDPSVDDEDLQLAARVAAGIGRLVRAHRLDALAYYHRGRGPSAELAAALILGGSLLTADGVPCAGEGDLKNAVAMLVLDRLGAGGSYTEFYAMDFVDDFVLMGHDGPGHVGICDRRPLLRGLGVYHGKAGRGVSVEFSVRAGPVTIFGVTQTAAGQLRFLVAEGRSVAGPVLRIGNTNSRLRFPLGPAEFVDAWCACGPTHHVALGIGARAEEICCLGELAGIETIRVC